MAIQYSTTRAKRKDEFSRVSLLPKSYKSKTRHKKLSSRICRDKKAYSREKKEEEHDQQQGNGKGKSRVGGVEWASTKYKCRACGVMVATGRVPKLETHILGFITTLTDTGFSEAPCSRPLGKYHAAGRWGLGRVWRRKIRVGKVGSRRTEAMYSSVAGSDQIVWGSQMRVYDANKQATPKKSKSKSKSKTDGLFNSVSKSCLAKQGEEKNEKRESEREIQPVSDASSAHKKARDHEGTSQDGRSEPRQRKKKTPAHHARLGRLSAFWQIGSPSYISQVSRCSACVMMPRGGVVGRPIGGRAAGNGETNL